MKCLTKKKGYRLGTLLLRHRPVHRLTSDVQYKKTSTATYVILMTVGTWESYSTACDVV